MTTVEQKVARLEREVQEIRVLHKARADATAHAVGHVHDELMAFRAESAGNFAEVNGRLDRVDERFTEVNGRLDLLAGEVNSRLDRMEDTMAQILARLPEQRT